MADRPGWLPAQIPGDVHTALIAAGRLEHPYRGRAEVDAAWVAELEWWYRARVPDVPGAGARLVLEGLDGVADVWWNGTHLGHHINQFRPLIADVSALRRPDNDLLIRFTPPLAGRDVPEVTARMLAALGTGVGALQPGGAALTPQESIDRRTPMARASTLRKAAFSWGWDFAPCLPSIGPWRAVRLETVPETEVLDWRAEVTSLDKDLRQARVALRVCVGGRQDVVVRVLLNAPDGRRFEQEMPVVEGVAEGFLDICDPQLWWPHDLGTPHLHDLTLELVDAQASMAHMAPMTSAAVVRHRVTARIGLRTVTLDRAHAAPHGERRLFRFVLNHRPVFARGANWVPAGAFAGSVDPEAVTDLVARSREAGFTMLRVWGGGVYEDDRFYDACDAAGVMVWQDFMFTSIDIPDDLPALRTEVRAEAVHQIRRLRPHPSVVMWAGNNEVQLAHEVAYGTVQPGPWGWHLYHELLPAAVAEHSPRTPYWPGSPWGERGGANGAEDGDRHNWEVWHGLELGAPRPPEGTGVGDRRHYRRYADESAAFVSEFGIASDPAWQTLRTWLDEGQLVLEGHALTAHVKDRPVDKVNALLEVTTGLPRTVAQRIAFTQAVQAEGMAFAVACFRRRTPLTSGALVWQLNDSWPGFSWSLVDYDGRPKHAYHATARACAAVMLSFADDGRGGLELWAVNDGPTAVDLLADVALGRIDGEESVTRVRGRVEPGRPVVLWRGESGRSPDRYAWATSPEGVFPPARTYFCEIGQLPARGKATCEAVADDAVVVRAEGHAYAVRLEVPHPRVRLGDNWFDLRAGEERKITVRGCDPTQVTVAPFPFLMMD